MLKKIIFLFLSFYAFAMDIDISAIKQAVNKNPNDIQNRMLLAKYFEKQKKFDLAQKYLKEILKIDPKNKKAKNMLQKVIQLKNSLSLKKEYGDLDILFDNLYKAQKYKKLLKLYIKTKPKLNKKNLLNIARVAMWEGKYDLSLNILKKLKKSLDSIEIEAYDYFYKGDIKKANRLFKLLYSSTGNKDYGQKLLETYLQLGDYFNAKKVLYSLKYSLKKDIYNSYLNKINLQTSKYIVNLKKEYKKNPNFNNLKKLVIALFNINQKEAIQTANTFVKQHPDNQEADILLAKLLTWNGETQKATQYLDKYKNSNNYNAKLLYGKILAWNGMYKKAQIFLSDVYENGNKTQKYNALKMLGFIAMWKNNKKTAKKIFNKLLKENPKDTDIKEALMIMDNNIKPLIKKYQKILNKNPNNSEIILKLADLYYMDRQYEKSAKLYEKYLKLNPDKIEIYKTLGDIYLELKKFYKGFANWEYYANVTNTKENYLQLAQRYYWNGFTKAALEVLNKLLQKYPSYKKAIELKAQILKINPRFIENENATAMEKYFNTRAEKLLIYANRSYYAGLYVNAAKYYNNYLLIKPDDENIREKYAYSLEFSGNYADAAGEFYNILWNKKEPLLRYHYAYNLQKMGKTKKAKKIYLELLKNVPKPLPKRVQTFLDKWKKAWEEMDFKKYSSFYDSKITNNLYWRLKKQNIFKNASFISVGIYDPVLLKQKKDIYVIKFFQVYASKPKKDKGYKFLTLKCDKENCKIIKETWQKGVFIPKTSNNLEYLIKKNLSEIKSQNLFKKKILKKTDFIPLNKAVKQKSKITLAVKHIKRESNLSLIKESLNIQEYIPVKENKKNFISKDLPKTYNHKADIKLYHFEDNKHTFYNQTTASLSNDFGFYRGVFIRYYRLSENSKKDKGFLAAALLNYKTFKIKAGIDYANNTNLYIDINTPFLHRNLDILYENLVYSRRTICSLKDKRIQFNLSKYEQITSFRALWYSLALEYITDTNIVFTPQFEYDFYHNNIFSNPYNLFISGWYQFNSKKTPCYYSPKKTDSTFIGIKYYPKNRFADILIKGGIGYSFFDKSFLYNFKIDINKNYKTLNFNTKCEYSNTNAINNPANYKSLECSFDIGKKW